MVERGEAGYAASLFLVGVSGGEGQCARVGVAKRSVPLIRMVTHFDAFNLSRVSRRLTSDAALTSSRVNMRKLVSLGRCESARTFSCEVTAIRSE